MYRSAIPIGKYLGVEIRIHVSFLLLLAVLVPLSTLTGTGAMRGLGVWLAIVFAVAVRETARALTAVYTGLRIHALFLLPVGGVMAFAPADAGTPAPDPAHTRWVAAAGPAANLLAGLLILGLAYAIDPRVSLLAQPWISLTNILRTFLWMQIILGVVTLLPTTALPLKRLFNLRDAHATNAASPPVASPARRVLSFGPATPIGLGLIFAGLVLPSHLWLVLVGAFLLLGAQLANIHAQATGTAAEPGTAILVREVMLTDLPLLSSSDTLRGALDRVVHGLHDTYPVVRGDRLVGFITRQTIADRLLSGGDSYLQGAMSRSFPLAAPNEPLGEALRRASATQATDFIPVIDDGALVGLLTPQGLTRALQQVKLIRPELNSPRQN